MSTSLAVRTGLRTAVATTVLALVAGLLLVVQVAAAPLARAADFPAVDPDRTATTDAVGSVGTGPSVAGSSCGSVFSGQITLLTGLAVGTGASDRVANLGLECAIPDGAPVDPATAPAPSIRLYNGETLDPTAPTTDCPTGAAVVGLQGRLVENEIGAAGDAFADVRVWCSPLGTDGQAFTALPQPWATGSGDGTPSDVVLCPAGQVGYQVGGFADTQHVYGLTLTCTAPVYDPAVVAATYPQTAPALFGAGVGDTSGSDQIPAACGRGVLATGLRVAVQDNEGSSQQLAALGVTCAPLTSASAPTALDTAAAVPSVDPLTAGADTTADCPAGQVLTGVGGTGANVGSADILGAVRGYCSILQSDGTTTIDGEPVGTGDAGITGGFNAGAAFCPAQQVVTGLALALTDAGYGPTPIGLQISCSAITLAPAPPAATNSSWTTATELAPNATTTQSLSTSGAALWFKVPVQPSSTVRVDLDQLPADDDLAVFTDIGQAFTALSDTGDLTKLSAEFAAVDVAPTTFSPTTFSPTTFSPTTFSPTTFSPTTFSPTTFSPTTFSPTTFSPTTFSPTTFSPTTFSPTTFSPAVTPDQYVAAGRFPDLSALAGAFSAAQTRSLVAVSAHTGLTPESWSGDTYNRSGWYYLRVTGRDGATSPSPFRLAVTTTGGPCDVPLDTFGSSATLVGTPGAGTVVVTDTGRFTGAAAGDVAALEAANDSLVAAASGRGRLAALGPVAVVDVAASPRVQQLQDQADAHPGCPYAKTLVAQAVRDIVNSYRGEGSGPAYVVIEGGDAVVPFFRYADGAGVAPESGYVPPVATSSASDASLRNDFVLGQDAYGAAYDLTIGGSPMPVPDAAVGRLVETPAEITAALTSYVWGGGAAIDATSTLATGYDFLTAGADQVAASFAAGAPDGRHDTLVTKQGVDRTLTTVGNRPDPDHTWTAADLRSALLGSRHDVVYLAGHFSSSSALAADFSSVVSTADLATAPAGNFAHTLVFSAGCHSGYNLVDGDAVAGASDPLDWAQAFAQQGATLVAGTGYQYGDTDFVKYGNQLYVGFAEALRRGTGPVAVGAALVQAKRDYLAGQPTLDGIDRKSLLQATVYGLPMQGVDFPAGRIPAPEPDGPVTTTTDTTDPGLTLGLARADLTVDPALTPTTRTLTGTGGGSVTATYLTAPGGQVTSTPGTPTLPVVGVNATAPAGSVLRGVGFREGTYTDTLGVTPLTGAPATETNTVHGPFVSSVPFPSRLATPNVYDALPGGGSSGASRLFVTPAQYVSDAPGSLTDRQRAYSHLGFTTFYSGNTATYGANTPATAAAPTITDTSASATRRVVTFSTRVVGDPAAGVAGVWVTWTVPPSGAGTGRWQSVDLTQDPADSTLWTGSVTLPAGARPGDLRFLVQAVNGVGLVGVDDAVGAYHRVDAAATTPVSGASLQQAGPLPASVTTGAALPVGVTLLGPGGSGLAGRSVTFTAGGSSTVAVTDRTGRAAATLPVTAAPGTVDVTAAFPGDDTVTGVSTLLGTVTIAKRPAAVAVTPVAGGYRIAVRDTTRPGRPVGVPARTAAVVAAGPAGTVLATRTVRLDALGTGTLATADVPAGTQTLTGWFGSAVTPVTGGGVVDLTDPFYAPATPASLDLRPATLTITPGRPTTTAGTPVAFTVTATSGGVSTDVTDRATFTVTRSGGASAPDATCSGASCGATTAGTYAVVASYLGATARAVLAVGPAATDTVRLTPSTARIAAGAAQGYVVRAYDRYGNVRSTAPATLTITPQKGGSADGAVCTRVACSATAAGTYRVTASRDGATATATLTVVPSAPAVVLAYGGLRQQTPAGTSFPAALTALVQDAHGNPVAGAAVRFDVAAGGDGAGTATFPGGATGVTVPTGADGLASAPPLTGRTAGPVAVTAVVAGVATPASYDLAVTSADDARADLAVGVSLAPQSDGTVRATVTVRNDGPDRAANTRVSVTLTGPGVVSDPGPTRQVTPRLVRLPPAGLAAGQSVSFTLTITRVATDKPVLVVASALSSTTDPDMDDNTASAVVAAQR